MMATNGEVETGLLVPDLLDLDLSESEDKDFVASVGKAKGKSGENPLNDDESLISEDDVPNCLPSDLVVPNFDDKGDSGSVSSVGSHKQAPVASTSQRSKSIQPANILRHVILRAVSSQLQPNIDEIIVGTPSAMCVGSLIAIGTSHGVIMCFDCSQRLRWRHEGDREQGPVTAMTFNADSTRLLVGFARGMILMLDVHDAKILRTIPPEAHTYNTAVVHLKFTDSPALALLSDSGGSVFEINLKRVLGVRSYECKCIFSGSRGEVIALEPLLLQNLSYQHPLAGFVVVAMATFSKIILVSLRPQTRLLFTQSIKSTSTSLPLLSWQFVVIQVADASRVMDPVLAVARNDTIYFYQVSLERSGKITCQGLQSVSLPYSLISCHWLTARTVALIDINEMLHLFDVRTKQELECLDLSVVELVYNSAAFKGLATGGNVSKAMALAGQRAVYNSIYSFGNQLLLLGVKTLHLISIRVWFERIDGLVRAKRYEDALKLAMDFYEEKGKAVLGLKGAREERQKLVREKLLETLEKFVEVIIADVSPINYSEAIPIVIEYSIELDRMDLVYDKLWNGLSDGKNFYLEAIESALTDGKITEVPPEIMQTLVNYQQSLLRWEQLENCIQRVNVPCLDIEQVILICKRENLYSALISVWNRAMNDFTSPIHELIPKLNLIQDTKEKRKLGNLILVYISSCLSGSIGPDRAEHARQQVVRALCSQHSQNADDEETIFPFIRSLLEFDTREFLNSLVISFSDASLSMQIKQRLVDIIIQVMSGDSFKCTEVSRVLCVLNSSAVGRGLRIDPTLYTDAVSRLVTDDTVSSGERQQAFLQLVTSGSLSDLNHETLLELAKSAEFHQVCAILHEIRGEYPLVLKYNLLDQTLREHIFSFIEQSEHKMSMGLTEPETLKDLLSIDAKKTGQIFVRYIPQAISNILPTLPKEQLYYFLKGMQEESDLDTELMTNYVCLMCSFEPENVCSVVKANSNIELDPAIKVAQEKGLDEVTAVLLERSGDLQGAFNVLLSKLERAIENCEENVDKTTEELVSLAQRGNTVLDSKTSWLPLLMCLLKLNSHSLLQRVLNNADLNLVSELHLLMQHTQGTLGELRGLIMGLFVKCRDQRRMLEATKRLHMSGLHGELADVIAEAKIGCRSPQHCGVCKGSFTDKFCLFRCGHGFHTECIPPTLNKCKECFKDLS